MINNEYQITRDARRATGVWWRAVRPFAYPASVVPALLGIAVAWSKNFPIRIDFAILSVIGAVAAHTGANLMNDCIDFKRGVDRTGTFGGSGILVEGILPPSAILKGSILFFAIAALIALPLCVHVGWPLVLLILFGFLAGAGYVLPPFGFKYRALGDLTVFSSFGIGITLGSYMIQTGTFSWAPIFYAIPIGLFVAAILHINNIRDMSDDRESSFKTFAGILGSKNARAFYSILIFMPYILTIAFVLLKQISPGSLLAVITLPLAVKIAARVLKSEEDDKTALIGADAKTAQLNLFFGLAMILGILLFFWCRTLSGG